MRIEPQEAQVVCDRHSNKDGTKVDGTCVGDLRSLTITFQAQGGDIDTRTFDLCQSAMFQAVDAFNSGCKSITSKPRGRKKGTKNKEKAIAS